MLFCDLLLRMDRELGAISQMSIRRQTKGEILHVDRVKHRLESRVALVEPLAEALQLRAPETQLNRSPRLPAQGSQFEDLLGLGLDPVDHLPQLVQGALASGQTNLTVVPQFIFDEAQVGGSTVDEGAMDGLEVLRELGELRREGGETRVGGSNGSDDGGDCRRNLREDMILASDCSAVACR